MIWPSTIRWFSVPSLIVSALFLWNGMAYLLIFRSLPTDSQDRKKFIYFGLTSLSLAPYSLSAFFLYSSFLYSAAAFWQSMQFVSLVFFLIYFALFCVHHMRIHNFYWKYFFPAISLIFLPLIFIPEVFLTSIPAPKVFGIFNYHTRILEVELGPAGVLFVGWALGNLFYLGLRFVRFESRRLHRLALPIYFLVFTLAAVNDSLVAAQVYRFFYLLEFSFLGFTFWMGYNLFSEYQRTTHELAGKKREVEKLNEEMQFLLHSISHDLNAPLVSVRGFVQVLQDPEEKSQEALEHYLKRIQVNSDQMSQMLSELIAYLRIGRMEMKMEDVDLKRVVHEILDLLGHGYLQAGEAVDLPREWPTLYSSENAVRQILQNLLQNAIKYSPAGQVYLCLRFEEEEEGLKIFLSDRGPGIPPAMEEKIFSPFFRMPSEVPGSGMGLAIVKKTAENLGGDVWLDREYKDGAKFCVYLPQKKE